MSKITFATNADIQNLSGGSGMSEEDKNKLDSMVIKKFIVNESNWVTTTVNGKTVYKFDYTHNLGTSAIAVTGCNKDSGKSYGNVPFDVVNSNNITVYSFEKINGIYTIIGSK